MKLDIKQKEILRNAIDTYGEEHQLKKFHEEFAELTLEVCRVEDCRGNPLALAEEIADCKIMLAQLEMIFDNKYLVRDFVNAKIKRLGKRLSGEE